MHSNEQNLDHPHIDPNTLHGIEALRKELAIDHTLIDDRDVAASGEYREAVKSAGVSLRRLNTVHEMANAGRSALKQMASSNVFWGCATASWLATNALLLGTGQGAPLHTTPDLIDFDMLKQSIPSLGMTGTAVTAVLATNFDRAYARLTGMSKALQRMQDGADPNGVQLKDRLSIPEMDAYGSLLQHVYAASGMENTQERVAFIDAAHDSIDRAVERYSGTKDAPKILDVINDFRARLEDGQLEQGVPAMAQSINSVSPAQPGM